MEAKATLNIDQICRVCLEEKEDAVSIFSPLRHGVEQNTFRVAEVIMKISEMKISPNDGLPQIICRNCMGSAYIANNFQRRCNRSFVFLQEYLEKVKTKYKEPEKALEDEESDCLANECKETDLPKQNCKLDKNNEIIEDVCENSNTEFENNEDESSSKEEEMDEFPELHSCGICSRVYKSKPSLALHIKRKHSKFSFHMKSHDKDPTHICKICGKKYMRASSLTIHMRVHTGHRPYLCTICGKGFRQAPDLRYHMRIHSKEKRYMCNICGKTMTMQCHLVNHMRTHTGERPFKCNECTKSFTSSTTLKRHSITHTDLKPFKCDVCDKSFNRLSTLKVHAKIHSDEREYVCSVCSKRFIQAHTMKNHMLTHTANNT